MMVLILCCRGGLASACERAGWPEWAQFRTHAITLEGQVIDHAGPSPVTTSEGQAYALFFALVDQDRALFDRLLRWTQTNLARGSLMRHLPAWKWGVGPSGKTGVLDDNAASDADLWLAYSLLEAGRLWQQPRYAELGAAVLDLIARRELVDLPGLGPALLPGPEGFAHAEYWILNPSYVPLQLVDRLVETFPQGPWKALRATWVRVLMQGAPHGFAPDWVGWSARHLFISPPSGSAVGSYDAVRVYLWIGMLADEAPLAAELKAHFRAIRRLVSPNGRVAERVDSLTGQAHGRGPVGFAAALLPFFRGTPVEARLARAVETAPPAPDRYYDQVLTLFAQGWRQGRYRFDSNGFLKVKEVSCP